MRRLSVVLLVLLTGTMILLPSASAQRFLGSISLVPYNFAPLGSAFCNGQLLPINQNDALFALIGTTYGGDGQSTFALPDLRGRVAIHQGQGPGLSPYVIGQLAGEETVSLTINQVPAHTHTAVASASYSNTVSPAGAYWAPRARTLLFTGVANLVPMASTALAQTGSGQPHDNMKPFLTLNYVIWLEGIFPTQN